MIAVLAVGAALGADFEGEVRLQVLDPSGAPVVAKVDVESLSAAFRTEGKTDLEGRLRLRRLPVGEFWIIVEAPGFSTALREIRLDSAIPMALAVELEIESERKSITVEAQAPDMIDRADPTVLMRVDRETLDRAPFTTTGRSVIDQVTDLPGWLLEANAVLHPRGSEYDTQYVVDGVPVYDNRSIGFVPGFDVDEMEAIHVWTAGIPAEYGRRLGGVVELFPRRSSDRGHHPEATYQVGSFRTLSGAMTDHYQGERFSFSAGLRAGHTERYLDPPSLENFTNKASNVGAHGRFDFDATSRDRLTVFARRSRIGFLVPNDLTQQAAGQRQDRRAAESAGQVHWQRTVESRWVVSTRGMFRRVDARLWSNRLSTPLIVDQDRGIDEGVVSSTLTRAGERHVWKAGGDYRTADLRERFSFIEADEPFEDPFRFNHQERSHESSFFVQDSFRWKGLALNAGLRFDRYSLFIEDNAWSPRAAASYYLPKVDLQLRASYDRVFQTPPLENLLLSSSADLLGLDLVDGVEPVPPSRADFYEVGIRKAFAGRFRLDLSHYRRDFQNYFDDDVFLNTGIGFPISFAQARIQGTEARLEILRWHGLTGAISYSNMHGVADSPVTGGLFVEGGEAEELRDVRERFAVTQDQRNTASARLRWEPHPRLFFGVRARYGSGLPFEAEDDDDDDDEDGPDDFAFDDDDDEEAEGDPISPDILNRINFARGRVRQSFQLDFSVGGVVWKRDHQELRLQFDMVNVGDRLNVVNFSGAFSGTALAPPRMAALKLHLLF